MTKNFRPKDFLCLCGCGLGVQTALIAALQAVRDAWGRPMTVLSGARCPSHNAAVGGALGSAHIVGMAADIRDRDGALKAWVAPRLEEFDLWMEEPRATPKWAHLQIRPAEHRVFKP